MKTILRLSTAYTNNLRKTTKMAVTMKTTTEIGMTCRRMNRKKTMRKAMT